MIYWEKIEDTHMSKSGFFGQNPSYSSKFSKVARICLDYRAILARDIYKILVSSIDILHIHVHIFWSLQKPE